MARIEPRRPEMHQSQLGPTQECSLWNTNCIERALRKLFNALGGVIGRFPIPFIMIPLILSVSLGPGLILIRTVTDMEYLYTPTGGPAKTERDDLNREFPFNDSGQFSRLRQPHLDGSLTIIFESKTDNILTNEIMQDILDFDNFINEINITSDGESFTYIDICSTWRGKCSQDSILEILEMNASMTEITQFKYPEHGSYILQDNLGGVLPVPENNVNVLVQSAKAMKLSYNVKTVKTDDKKISSLWLAKCIDKLQTRSSNKFSIHFFSSESMEQELEKATGSVIPLFSVTYSILITFTISSCMIIGNWVTSKPWLAVTGVLAAGMSILSAFGLMCYIGVDFASQVATMPFLALGIGVDDMFVLLSAWRRTNVHDSVTDRMRATMEEAGVSITITSLTNTLAFGIGAITAFRSIQIFCLYTGVSVLFCYLYSITFFAGFLTVFGWRENANRHCYACTECTPSDSQDYHEKSMCHKIWCTGGFTKGGHQNSAPSQSVSKEKRETPHHAMEFFKNYYARFLMNNWVRVIVFLLYLGYLTGAIFGCTQVREGLQLNNLAPTNSYLARYYEADNTYFKRYGLYINVVVKDQYLDYNQQETQDKILTWISKFESNEYFMKDRSMSWLNSYDNFRRVAGIPRPSNSANFINSLNTVFFTIPGFDTYSTDVSIDGSDIKSSRFFVLSRGLTSSNDERFMMEKAREIANDLGLTVFHPAFIFYDQYQVVLINTLQNMGIAVGCMIVISLLMVPYMICSLYIGLSIASIITGVVGYMTLWGVNLDSISMINLILCIGFSVDYTAHITYSFVGSKASTRKEKVVDSLYDLGFPVLQGAVSTVLGVVVLFFSATYIFEAFAKIMLFVIVFAAMHGLVVLPVVLSVIGPS